MHLNVNVIKIKKLAQFQNEELTVVGEDESIGTANGFETARGLDKVSSR